MSLAYDLYTPGNSWLHRLDPRVKLWGTTLGAAIAFALPSVVLHALFLLGTHLLLSLAGVPRRRFVWLWRQMLVLVALILALQPFFVPSGKVLVDWGPIQLTMGGLYASLLLALRALNLAFVVGGLLFTTSQWALVRAFVRLGLPYTWGLTITLTLRFIPTIESLFVTVREAQAARGWVSEGNFLQRLRDYLPVLVAVVIGTLRMSDQLTLALAARGLAPAPRTSWRELEMRPADWIALALITLGTGLFFIIIGA